MRRDAGGSNPSLNHCLALSQAHNRITMRVIKQRESSCVRRMFVNPLTGEASVTFKNGKIYDYIKVSRLAIIKLMLDDKMSLGSWVNRHLLDDRKVKCIAYPAN